MRLALARRALVVIAAMSLLAVPAVSAETLLADGDVVTAGVQGTVDLGTVGPGADVHVDVGFLLACSGTSHIDAGQTIRLTPGPRTIPPGGSFGFGSVSFTTGPGWPADGEACPAGLAPIAGGPAHVILTAPPDPGLDYLYSFTWTRSLSPGTLTDGVAFEGPSTTVVFTLDVADNTPPELHLPADTTVEGNTTGGAIAAYTAIATDAEDVVAPTPTCAPAVGSVLSLGLHTVNCSVTDGGGLMANGSFGITVVDTTAPTLSGVPAGLSLATGDPSGAVLAYSPPTATDIVDPAPTVNCSPAPGMMIPVGDTTVSCVATDASGNQATGTFGVHVALAQALWDEPVDGTGMSVNGSRTLPIKVRLLVDGRPVTSGQPSIVVMPCAGGGPVGGMDLSLQSGRRWVGHLSTDGLAPGCYRVVAMVGGLGVGGFGLEVRGDSVTLEGTQAKGRVAKP